MGSGQPSEFPTGGKEVVAIFVLGTITRIALFGVNLRRDEIGTHDMAMLTCAVAGNIPLPLFAKGGSATHGGCVTADQVNEGCLE
jgi:hypothetical protein